MADNNLLFLNDRLFARKGEAAPATLVTSVFEGEGLGGDEDRDVTDTGSAAKRKVEPKRSPLSFLIQRQMAPEDTRTPARRVDGGQHSPRDLASGRGEHAFHPTDRVREEMAEFENTRIDHCPRRKLTVRLAQEDFQRVKALAEFWDTTYQSLLERGVRSYVLSVQSAERDRNTVKQGVRATVGRPR